MNPSALTLAAHLLGRTSRMRVGTAVTILPTLSPVAVAEQAALLDQLSGGRFDLGVGRAGPVVDYEVLDRTLGHWRSGLPEALEVLLRSFGGRVAADGEHYRFREVAPAPRPATTPHPSVFLPGSSERTVDLAAAHGLPLLFFLFQGPDEMTPLIERHAAATGTDPAAWAHGSAIVAHVTDTAEEAHHHVTATMAPFFTGSHAEYVLLAEHVGGPPPGAIADLMLRLEAVGPVEHCVERILAREVLPRVRAELAAVPAGAAAGGAR